MRREVPGRTFLFDENDVADRLAGLDEITNGALRWSEAAGLKQVVRNAVVDADAALALLARDYDERAEREAA